MKRGKFHIHLVLRGGEFDSGSLKLSDSSGYVPTPTLGYRIALALVLKRTSQNVCQ